MKKTKNLPLRIHNSELFVSPTLGPLKLSQVVEKLVSYHNADVSYPYRIIIGTDSQEVAGVGTSFVTAVICHRVGAGGIYFWRKTNGITTHSLKQRVLQEAVFSLELAEKLTSNLAAKGLLENNLEIHVDIGHAGPTREVISEVIGMVRASGFAVKIKPDSFGATKVADRHV